MSITIQRGASAGTKPPLPTGLLIATWLVVALALTRGGLLAWSVMNSRQLLAYPPTLIQSLLLPTLLLALTIVMITLIFARTPSAKPFGITVCVAALLFQALVVFSVASVYLGGSSARGFPIQFVALSAASITVFTLELIFLALWTPEQAAGAAGVPARGDAMTAPQKGGSYFARHWRGELSLPRSYWLNGVLIFGIGCNLLFVIATAVTVLALRSNPGAAITLLLGEQALDITAYVWALVGTWRAATYYEGRRFWAVLARIGIVLGVLVSIGHVAQNLQEIGRIY